jgi:phosphatidate cytidylyltransferase
MSADYSPRSDHGLPRVSTNGTDMGRRPYSYGEDLRESYAPEVVGEPPAAVHWYDPPAGHPLPTYDPFPPTQSSYGQPVYEPSTYGELTYGQASYRPEAQLAEPTQSMPGIGGLAFGATEPSASETRGSGRHRHRRTVQSAPHSATTVPVESVPGRSGRNLGSAIVVGAGLGVAAVVSLYLATMAFAVLVMAVTALAVRELADAFHRGGLSVPLPPLMVGAAMVPFAAYFRGGEATTIAMALTVLTVVVWRMPLGATGFLRDATAGTFVVIYVPFLASFATDMASQVDGARRVTVLLLVTAASDIGGYAVGAVLGRHPMAPRVSPKKSWEGFAGSILAGIAVSALALPVALGGTWWQGLIVGIVGVAAATLGDLTESLIKRDLGVKDMSTALPGHGGIMDRLDSLLATAPVIYLLLTILVPPG